MTETWYCFIGLTNDDGDRFGTCRYKFVGDRESAIARFPELFCAGSNGLLGMDFAGDIRGMTPKEAAESRITDDPGDSEDFPWGYPEYSDAWNQQISETLS